MPSTCAASPSDRHQTVDDTPFGGGAGMVMRPDIVARALDAAVAAATPARSSISSPRGEPLRQARVRRARRRPGRRAAVRPLRGRRPAGDRGPRLRSSSRSATSCCRAASLPPWRCSTPACGCCPGVVGAAASLAEESFAAGCSNIPTTPGRRSGRGARCPRCCCPAITPAIRAWRQRAGAGGHASPAAGSGRGPLANETAAAAAGPRRPRRGRGCDEHDRAARAGAGRAPDRRARRSPNSGPATRCGST